MKNSNNQRLAHLIEKHSLTRKRVAEMLCVNISTIDRWLAPPRVKRAKNPTYRAMPDMAMRLLVLQLSP